MRILGNIMWFFLGGWLLFLVYSLAAIIFFPVFFPLFRVARYALWPFGRAVVTQSQLKKYRAIKGLQANDGEILNALGGILNIVWMLTFGWLLALMHIIAAFFNLCMFFLIFTIPNIGGNWKMIRIAFMPFNKVIVPQELAEEIDVVISKANLNL